MGYKDLLEEVYDEVNMAERAVVRAMRLLEDNEAEDVFDEVYGYLSSVYREMRRLKIAISDAVEGVEGDE